MSLFRSLLLQVSASTLRQLEHPRNRKAMRRLSRAGRGAPVAPALPTNGGLTIDLRGHLALVTGASGELGRTMVRTLARAGADVAVHFRSNSHQAEVLVSELQSMGRKAIAVQADVTSQVSVDRMVTDVRGHLGKPDIVVINAVEQIHPWEEVLEESVEDYISQFQSCVLQSVYLAKATLPSMAAQGWGRVIGINTECTMQLLPAMSAYAAAKRGMDGLLRVLAREVGPDGITVNQVAPGWTLSEKDRSGTADDTGYIRNVPLRRRGTDQEVANVVAFLASDLASFVHGVYLPVCGGNVMPTV